MFKKFLKMSLVVAVVVNSLGNLTFASSGSNNNDTQVVHAKTAYINDVNEYGTNLNNDIVDKDKHIKDDTILKIESNESGEMTIDLKLDKEKISIIAFPEGKTENDEEIFYKGSISSNKYEIVSLSYKTSAQDSNIYFKSYGKKNVDNGVLKIYLKVKESQTRDYICIESFEFKKTIYGNFLNYLPINPLLGSWCAKEFAPIESSEGEDPNAIRPFGGSDIKYYYMTKTFYQLGDNSTHTIRFYSYIDYLNVPVGQEAAQYFGFYLYDKYCRFTNNTIYNSDTDCFLHIKTLSADLIAHDDTAWRTTKISGKVTANNSSIGKLSASIGVKVGAIGVSYSMPLLTTYKGTVNIDNTYTAYVNTANNYSRGINVKMSNDFLVSKENEYFGIEAMMKDYKNVATGYKSMKCRWNYTVVNGANLETYSTYLDHNLNINLY